jgi:NTE family protein
VAADTIAGNKRALVLGGGGVAGAAWLIGLMTGFADTGLELLDADLVLGTSAGANVAAQITSALSFEALYRRQTDLSVQTIEPIPHASLLAEAIAMRPYFLAAGDPGAIRRRRGRYATQVQTISEAERRAVIASRLPSHEWPSHPLKLVAVDAETGEGRVFDRHSGVSLIDAVAASSAVPGVWPTATITGRRYTDGGVRSPENADLAAGFESILVISPVGQHFQATPPRDLRADIAALERGGSRVMLIEPDQPSRDAITPNLLDPTTRAPAALAGRSQGRSGAIAVAAFWRRTGGANGAAASAAVQ